MELNGGDALTKIFPLLNLTEHEEECCEIDYYSQHS